MPAKKKDGEEEMEEFDFGFEEAASEDAPSSDLASISDEDLIEEMKKRGYEVEDEVEEDMEDSAEMPEMSEEELV